MGQVFEATHLELGKGVAIKLLRPDLGANEEAVARFRREAKASAAIGHPGIIDIYDIGVDEGGEVFLVMELLRGRSLAEHLDRQPRLDDRGAAFFACQVLSALSAAHDKGIVHRDLKPENIFLVDVARPLPEVKLLDFGISVILRDELDPNPRLTKTGAVLGTPYYMSPEQARGDRSLDHRTDLYSLGVILYECLTGRLPFIGENYNAQIAAILTQEPLEPSHFEPAISEAMQAIVMRALARDPGDRFPTARSMLAALEPLLDERQRLQVPLPGGAAEAGDLGPLGPSAQATVDEPISLAATAIEESLVAEERQEPVTEERLEPVTASTVDAGRGRPRRWPALVVAVIVVIGGALGFVVAGGRGDPGASAADPQAAAALPLPSPPPSPPPSPLPEPAVDGGARTSPEVDAAAGEAGPVEPGRSMEIRIAATPRSAQIFLDDAPLPSNPYQGRFPRNGLTRAVRITARGYSEHRSFLVFDRDRELEVALEREVRVRSGGGRPDRGKRGSSPQRDDPWRD